MEPKGLASVAQLVEHLTLNQVVVGSSPTGGTVESVLTRHCPMLVVRQK